MWNPAPRYYKRENEEMAKKLGRHKFLLLAASMAVVVLVAILGIVLSVYPALAAGQPNQSVSNTKEFTIVAKQFAYDPAVITVPYGARVTIKLESHDVEHGFYLDGYGINVKFDIDNPQTVTFIANKVGTFKYRCSNPCGPFHPFMRGKLVVEPKTNFIPWAMGFGTVGVSAAFVGGPAFVLWRKNKADGKES